MKFFIKKVQLLLCFALFATATAQETKDIDDLNFVFKAGAEGYKSFRIPALVVSKKGTLIAFAEGRVKHRGDHGDIDIVAKRSTDGGKTWSDLIKVRDDETRICGNPAPVVDQATDTIYLISCGSDGSEKQNMMGEKSREVYIQESKDDGKTWSNARRITDQVKKDTWGWFATGPCNAIQIQQGKYKGRFVVPSNISEMNEDGRPIYKGSCFYSDDKGKTWQIGSTSEDGANESTMAEVKPDLLVQNFRMQSRGKGKRAQRFSKDGGATWSELNHNSELFCCVCQGSILRDYSKPGLLYFSNPSQKGRQSLTIKASEDGGQTWPFEIPVFDKHSAYSNLAIPAKGKVGVLFEAGPERLEIGIAFESFPKSAFKKKEKSQ